MFSYAAAAAKSLQSCPTMCDPIDGSPPGSPSLGFSRQEHWGGLPFPSPMRESEVIQSCPTLSDPMGCSLPGSSVHGSFQARVLEWGAIAFSDVKLYMNVKNKNFYYKAFTQIWVYLVSGHLESKGRNTRLAEELRMPEVSVLRITRQPPHFQTPCPVYRKQGMRATDLLPQQLGLFAWEGKLGTCIPGQH